MADYDLYSNVKPVAGTAAEITMDGSTYTAAVDTFDWKSCVFLANIHANALYTDIDWTLQDSDDNVTFATVDSSLVINRNPSTSTTQNKAFHVGYIGKKRYVKATMDCDGTTAVTLNPTVNAAQSITSLTSSSTTATAVKASHGYVVGQYVTIAGASPAAYNGRYRIATVADSSHFTYTFAGGTSPATGTITAAGEDNWTNDEGADPPTSISDGASALSGTYTLTVSNISSTSAVARVARGASNTGTGAVTVASISATYANAIFNETLLVKCTATASGAGTFTVYRADGTIVRTITVGAGATAVQIDGSHTAFTLNIADGTPDWALNDVIEITITDLGKNRYILTNPDGDIVGYPVGTIAFTSSELNFTVPDTTVAVSDATATLPIVVTKGLAKGQIMALLSNPVSGPIFGESIET